MSARTFCTQVLNTLAGRDKDRAEWLQLFPRAYRSYRRPESAIGMTTDQELCFLETYAREGFSGKGRIVDLGCWLGATTISLARGLENNSGVPKRRWIDAVDRFIWDEGSAAVARKRGFENSLRCGDDFYDCVQQQLGRYAAWVNLEKFDLANALDQDGPIEFLFVDAMKSWPLANQITHNYLTRIIPGESYLVQQDFAYHHPVAATNHLIMWFLRDHFDWAYHVPRSASVAYRCKRAVISDGLPRFTESLFTLPEVNDAYNYSLQCVSADQRHHVRACKLCFLLERGWDEAAAHEAESMRDDGIRLRPHIMTDVTGCLRARRLKPEADQHLLTGAGAAIDVLGSAK
jgi:hypothetical protein